MNFNMCQHSDLVGKPVEKGEEEFNEWMDTNHDLQVSTAFKR
jgi:hypothetical protein